MRLLLVIGVLVLLYVPLAGATHRAGEVRIVERSWVCNAAVDLDLVKITLHRARADAISLSTRCTGRIGRVEVDIWGADALKIQNASTLAAHDLVIGGGYLRCHEKRPSSAHQDGIQAMGGARITFNGLQIHGCDTQGIFINRAGGNVTTPTDIVCNGCLVGEPSSTGGPATPVNINRSLRSGLRNSTVCRSPRFNHGIRIGPNAVNPVNSGNTVLPVGAAACR